MTSAADPGDAPPRSLRFRRRLGLRRALRDLWGARELLRALAEREFQARYAQTLLGLGWVIATPLALMAVFAVFIDGVADIDTGDAPYTVFVFIGLLPWAFFSSSVSRGSMILVFESSVLTKVRCPREVFPLASVAVSAYELCVSLVVLGALFVITGFEPRVTAVWVPLIFLVQVAFTVGLVLVVAPIVVHVRDLGIALPVLLQVGLFATPVAYGADAVSHGMQPVWAALNPLVGVIESYRQTMLYGFDPPARLLLPAAGAAVLWLVGGYLVFKRMETGIPDVA